MRRSTCWAGVLLLLFSAPLSPGQDTKAPASQVEAMKKLDFLIGQWQGESWLEFAPGQRRTARGTETVQSKLAGLVLTIDGIHTGKVGDQGGEAVVHNAFAVISYDEKAKRYRFQAYTARGSYTEAEAKVGDRSLEWGMRLPQAGDIRYTIKLNDQSQWFEIGEISRDGKEWRKFFEMTLERVKDRGPNRSPAPKPRRGATGQPRATPWGGADRLP